MKLKHSLLKYFILFFLIAILQISIVKNQHTEKNSCKKQKVTITGTININNPYCGGAAPPPDIANGSLSPYQNSVFYLVIANDTTRTPFLRFTTSNNGSFEIKVPQNSYWIFHEDKMLPFNIFYKQNSQNTPPNSISADIDCYREWYNRPDFEFTANIDTSIFVIFYKSCFVGMNPCLQYTGPLPPR